MKLTVGTGLQDGKYLIDRVVGQADLTLTLQGTQTRTRPVVLKTLKPELQSHMNYAALKQQFQEQIRRFAACQHPALVQLIDSFEEQNLPFAVTDFTPGNTLAEIVTAQGALPIAIALRYIQQVGAALEVLHRQGFIHRNITPQAIVQPPASNIVVLTSMEFVDGALLELTNGSKTPIAGEYAAIEQYQSQPQLTPATDVYSLAGTLYFLLTGQSPIAAPLRGQTAIVSPRQFCPQLDPALETAILQGLELNPKARPAAIAEWLFQLTSVEVSTSPVKPEYAAVAQPQTTVPVLPSVNGSVNSLVNGSVSGPTAHGLSTQPRSKPVSPSLSKPMISRPSKRFSGAVVTTAALAAAIGIGVGLTLRFAATTTGPGASFFNSEQSFPVLNDWPGEVTPVQQPVILPKPAVTELQPGQLPAQFEAPPPVPPAAAPVDIAPPPEVPIANPEPVPSPASVEPQVPSPGPAPGAIAPEPVPSSPAIAPEPAPPPPPVPSQPVSQPVPPPPLAN